MESVTKLISRVNNFNADIYERYPELLEKTPHGTKNILYVSPMYNKQGLYRMILPALELKLTGKFNTIVTNVLEDDSTRTIDSFDVKLVPELIKWADYIIFPASGQSMANLITQLKKVNPKIQVVMDMDRNYHSLNPNNYTAKRFNIEKLRNLEANLGFVDFSTYPDWVTENFYKKKIALPIKTARIPNLLSPFQFEGINKDTPPAKDPKTEGKFGIILMSDPDDFDDINCFREAINSIMIRCPEAIVYVMTNSINFMNKNPLRTINYNRVPFSDMTEYYRIIHAMNPGLAIIPLKKQPYSRPYYKMLELGAFGIPIITMNEYPYNHLLKKDQHIVLSGQRKTFVDNVRKAIDEPESRINMGAEFKKYVKDTFSFLNPKMLEYYTNFFV